MILISYDIADDRLRRRFAKFISRFGHRVQYSVYEIDNGPRILDCIMAELEADFERSFGEEDSVMIMRLSQSCRVVKYGYAAHEDEELLIV